MQINPKYTKSELDSYLIEFDFHLMSAAEEVSIVVIGSGYFILQEISNPERLVTVDIDAMTLEIVGGRNILSYVDLYTNSEVASVINSAALNSTSKILERETNFTEYKPGEFLNLKVFFPSLEMMITLKLGSMSRLLPNYRPRDLMDISTLYVKENVDFDKVKLLIDEWSEIDDPTDNNIEKENIFACFDIWIKELESL